MADRDLIAESFLRVKEDIARLNSELLELKQEHKRVLEENIALRTQANGNNSNGHSLDEELVSRIVQETIKNVSKNRFNDSVMKRLNKKRSSLIRSKILNLASEKSLSVPDLKEVVVDRESLCSKATFYRYLHKMKKEGRIETILINNTESVVRLPGRDY